MSTEILGTPMGSNDADAATVGDYLCELLTVLWRAGEDAIKRPFGNSGWQYEVYAALVAAGHVEGRIDEDGYLEDVDNRAADDLIVAAIAGLLRTGDPAGIETPREGE